MIVMENTYFSGTTVYGHNQSTLSHESGVVVLELGMGYIDSNDHTSTSWNQSAPSTTYNGSGKCEFFAVRVAPSGVFCNCDSSSYISYPDFLGWLLNPKMSLFREYSESLSLQCCFEVILPRPMSSFAEVKSYIEEILEMHPGYNVTVSDSFSESRKTATEES